MIYHVIWWTVQSTINWKIKSDIIKKIYSEDDAKFANFYHAT